MAKKGHHFPSSQGFTGSSGTKQVVRGYTRAKPIKKAAGGIVPRLAGMAGPQRIPDIDTGKPAQVPVSSSPKIPPKSIPPMRTVQPVRPGRGGMAQYADGGVVRQDAMKTSTIGDQGNATTQRDRPTSVQDQESGGKSPLRPGYKTGGGVGSFKKGPLFGKK